MRRLRLTLPLLGVLLAGCDVSFVAAPPTTPDLQVIVAISDSAGLRIELTGEFGLGRNDRGQAARVLDPTLRLGDVVFLASETTETRLLFRMTATDDDAEALLAAITSGALSPPIIEGFDPPPLLAIVPVRQGEPQHAWDDAGDLVLRTRYAGSPIPGASQPTWTLTLRDEQNSLFNVGRTGPVPHEVRIPASLLGPCSNRPMHARFFLAQPAPETRGANGYGAVLLSAVTLHWTVIRPCP